MKLNVTETNMLAVLVQRNGVPKAQVAPGGRYHVALAGLCRAGAAVLADGKYAPTEAGRAHLAGAALSEGGIDARSKMARLKPVK